MSPPPKLGQKETNYRGPPQLTGKSQVKAKAKTTTPINRKPHKKAAQQATPAHCPSKGQGPTKGPKPANGPKPQTAQPPLPNRNPYTQTTTKPMSTTSTIPQPTSPLATIHRHHLS